jgi:UDP-hydrolysing UDP-N-acetyl-D-glucosamine 2-epimerase
MMRVLAVTVARSDYGILRPVLDALRADPDFSVEVIAAATHLSPAFGLTVRQLEADGYAPVARVEMTIAGDTPTAIALSTGLGVQGFASAIAAAAPDLLLLVGDRFETLAAGVAAVPLTVPIVHLHGGEVTEGAFDDQIRHALTKMSHVHCVSTTAAARRVAQMGEEAWRICVSGAPGLDSLFQVQRLSRAALEARVGMVLNPAPLLVTFHPVTLQTDRTDAEMQSVIDGLAHVTRPIVITAPNADTSHARIRAAWAAFAASRPGQVQLVESLGTEAYVSLLFSAAAMVGNSSSGLIEAPAVPLPVVNIGDRQAGRDRATNVIDVPPDAEAIRAAIDRATSADFRASLVGALNPYGDGRAAPRMLAHLRTLPSRSTLLRKKFVEYPA